jgi:hypothetical protein
MYSLREEVSKTRGPGVNGHPGEEEKVKMVTLDTLFKELKLDHVDFCKIDIEGSEPEVFGSKGFENVADKIDTIMGEIHGWSGFNPKQIENSIRDRGFDFRYTQKTNASTFIAQHL